jgi:uncharacterized caspase-like protein
MATATTDLQSRRKIALIIGNSEYTDPSNKRTVSVTNAVKLAKKLKSLGFNVTKHENVKSDMFFDVFSTFRKTVKNDDMILIYFSGHTYQVNDNTYLLPIDDADIDSDVDVENFSLNIRSNLNRLLQQAKPYATFVILDYYHTYRLKRTSRATCKSII